jgi:hypothetical protein
MTNGIDPIVVTDSSTYTFEPRVQLYFPANIEGISAGRMDRIAEQNAADFSLPLSIRHRVFAHPLKRIARDPFCGSPNVSALGQDGVCRLIYPGSFASPWILSPCDA